MERLTARRVAAAMWFHRPAVAELLFWTVVVLGVNLLTGLPVALLALAAGLLLFGATLFVAIDDLTATRVIEAGSDGGDDAEN